MNDYIISYYVKFDDIGRLVFIDGNSLPFSYCKNAGDASVKAQAHFHFVCDSIKNKYKSNIVNQDTLHISNKPKAHYKNRVKL